MRGRKTFCARAEALPPTAPFAMYSASPRSIPSATIFCSSVLFPKSAERTDILCHFLFEPYEIAKADFDPSDAVEFWDITNRQDWSICESVQRGMHSRVHTHGYYSPMEDYSLDIRRYVRERLDAE